MLRRSLFVLLPAVAWSAASPLHAQPSLGLGSAQGPGPPQAAGTRQTFVCPAGDGRASVYGTDVYTAESGVCAAAIHAGVLKLGEAGAVTIVFGSGAESFSGTQRNGVRTLSYGRWPSSYTFARDGAPGRISWSTVWNQIPAEFFAPVTVECPGRGSVEGPIWGTDTYTKDSTICVAAVHAGVITPAGGGRVTVTRVPGLRDYPGTERFGVASTKYGAYPDAFTVTAAARGSSATPAPSPAPFPAPATPAQPSSTFAPQTLTLGGFTADGAQPTGNNTIAAQTVQLAGFTASGAAPANPPSGIGPRTTTTAGFTAVGSTTP